MNQAAESATQHMSTGDRDYVCIVYALDTGRFLIADQPLDVRLPNTRGTGGWTAAADCAANSAKWLQEHTGMPAGARLDFTACVSFERGVETREAEVVVVKQEYALPECEAGQGFAWMGGVAPPSGLHPALLALMNNQMAARMIDRAIERLQTPGTVG